MTMRILFFGLAIWAIIGGANFPTRADDEAYSDRGTPTAYLRIVFRDPVATATPANYRAEFDIFRNTQKQLMLTPPVLRAAAKNPKIAELPPVKEHKNIEQWLRNHLRIEFPDDAEIMKVGIDGADAKGGAMLVNAVVEAYMSEIVEAEQNKIQARICELNDTIKKKKDLLNSTVYDLRRMPAFYKPAPEMLTLQQKNVLEELALVRTAFIRAEYKLIEMKTELASKEALLRAAVETPITDVECLEFADSDSILKKLGEELASRKVAEDEKSKADLERVQKLYNERIERIRGEIAAKKRADIEKEVKSLQAAVAVAEKQPSFAEAEVKRLRKEADRFDFSQIDMPMLLDKIKDMEKTVEALVSEMNALLIESKTMPRIVVLSLAEIPE